MKQVLLAAMLASVAASGVMAKPSKSLDCVLVGVGTFGLSYIPGSKCNR